MNRHQRRAAVRQPSPKEPAANPPPMTPAAGKSAKELPHKPTLITRLLATVLLSRWVLARVEHPDVERLLINFATEAGRVDVADGLIRRQTLRAQSHSSPRP